MKTAPKIEELSFDGIDSRKKRHPESLYC